MILVEWVSKGEEFKIVTGNYANEGVAMGTG